MGKRWVFGAARLAAGLALGAGAILLGGSPALADQSQEEAMTEFAFDNPNVTVTAGQTVHFTLTNDGRFPHSMFVPDASGVKVLDQPGDPIAPGDSGALDAVFSQPGTYQFWCPVSNHKDRGMVGTITVLAAAQAAPPAPVVPAPKARDGQSLDTQSAATRATFAAVWGARAGTEWVKEHEAELARLGR